MWRHHGHIHIHPEHLLHHVRRFRHHYHWDPVWGGYRHHRPSCCCLPALVLFLLPLFLMAALASFVL